ncbi:MAG: bifunctional folylpolyglutamate synthase/dihydrofolate synthase [Bacteroidaceae bacterium]|nr:bifunctional folylpolyglutamate synthase/dihydrofolate synthase [Bacteroidaceae bacterium]
MTYEETIAYLYDSAPLFQNVGKAAYKDGLANTFALDEHFGHPHRQFKTIHVAGTNGKGSTSHTLAAILQNAGYRVGLYTSPHLVDFRERIRVNGEMVSRQFVVDFVEQNRDFFEPLYPSFFELVTAMAFKYFAEQKVDVAVIEVGLGGRLDCTNIIVPELSVITNISFDHVQFLGDTLEKIAAEKAGIIKQGVPVVIGEALPETRPVFEAKAQEMNAPIRFAEEVPQVLNHHFHADKGIVYKTKSYGEIIGELCGDCQVKNTNTILTAVHLLMQSGKFHIRPKDVVQGFAHVCEQTGLMGRWQTLSEAPKTVCDTGHNLGGFQYIAHQLAAQSCRQMRIVIGMAGDKDISGVLQLLPPQAIYYFTQASVKRALPAEEMQRIASTYGLHGQCYSTVAAAYQAAVHDAEPDDFIYIGGSSFVVADLLKWKIED